MMAPISDDRFWFLRVVEFLPLLMFVWAGRLGSDLSDRFLWSAGLAVTIAPVLKLADRRRNPLLSAVDIWLCCMAFSFLVYIPLLVDVLQYLQETSFFVVTLAVGVGYVVWSRYGLLTVAHDDERRVRGYSLALLALMAGALLWSVEFRGDEYIAGALPSIALFVTQMLMDARLKRVPPTPPA